MIKFLDLHAQYLTIKAEIDQAIESVIRDSAYISGPYAARFEEQFAAYTRSQYCVGVANGTDALEIAIEALELPRNSQIIVPGNSFIATSEAVTRSGHRVVFADVDPDCYTLTADTVQAKISPRTSAIIAVHLYGHPCDMDPLRELAARFGLRIIEDCAQAHGAEYRGRRVGALADVATHSFYPGKNLGAYGDAGAITTDDKNLAVRMRMIANHGRVAKYDHEFEGRNSRLDGLQGAILSAKLPHLDGWIDKRIHVAERYLAGLQGLAGLVLPVRKPSARPVYHLFVVRTERRDELKSHLSECAIETGIHYPIALPKLAAYAYLGQQSENLFVNRTDRSLLSLPMGDHLRDADVDAVIRAIKAFFSGA
jgi:dTDP-4-amino-4,6-dideoxygalactose transaminase